VPCIGVAGKCRGVWAQPGRCLPRSNHCKVMPHRGADREREYQCSPTDISAEPAADDQHAGFNQGAYFPDGPTRPPVQPGHQPIPGAGAEPRTNVEPGCHRQQQQSGGEQGNTGGEVVGRRQQPQAELSAGADQGDVEHGADARLLPQWPPQQQHHDTDQVGYPAEREAGPERYTLAEHIPGRDAHAGTDHQRRRDAKQEQPDQQLRDARQRGKTLEGRWGHGGSPAGVSRRWGRHFPTYLYKWAMSQLRVSDISPGPSPVKQRVVSIGCDRSRWKAVEKLRRCFFTRTD
jgi:hypothetical protein